MNRPRARRCSVASAERQGHGLRASSVDWQCWPAVLAGWSSSASERLEKALMIHRLRIGDDFYVFLFFSFVPARWGRRVLLLVAPAQLQSASEHRQISRAASLEFRWRIAVVVLVTARRCGLLPARAAAHTHSATGACPNLARAFTAERSLRGRARLMRCVRMMHRLLRFDCKFAT